MIRPLPTGIPPNSNSEGPRYVGRLKVMSPYLAIGRTCEDMRDPARIPDATAILLIG